MSVERLLRTLLYEGYALYPYRPSALKNQKRFAFGVVYPRAWAERTLEASLLRAEVVATSPSVSACVRYLRLERGGGARECTVDIADHTERDGLAIDTACVAAGDGLWRFAVEIRNTALLPADADHEAAMDVSPASTHVVLRGSFVSLIDPPEAARAAVAACRSTGLYPVLVGDDAMIASPIILPDQPQIAAQSPGDFFDGTEIDEMLTLRVLTMTEDEKREAAAADPRVRELIARTEQLGLAQTAQLHGTVRTAWPRPGTRVRLRPSRRADAFDVLLADRHATVAAVELDLEGRVHCAVTVDDDPAGHRFFFAADELEVLA